ncbi:unnamed protein product [Sympodiomycopsis kandeliae]
MVPALPLVFLIYAFPESPRWLMMKGRSEQALASLARLHARGDVSDAFVLAQAKELQLSLESEAMAGESGGSWRNFVTDFQTFRKMLLGITLQFSVQMTGVSAIQYYSPTIFKQIGFDTERTLLFNSIGSVFALVGEACCVLFIDRTGRRWPMILCNVGAGITYAISTAILAEYPAETNLNQRASYAFVVMGWFYQWFFSAGIGPLSWAYPVEIFNTAIRAKGTALASCACWISNFMIGQITPRALESIGWKYYLLFTICCQTNALVIYLFFPETKGRTLEEMDDFFQQTSVVVPLSSRYVPAISATAREEELRSGKFRMDGGLTDIDAEEGVLKAVHGGRNRLEESRDEAKSYLG